MIYGCAISDGDRHNHENLPVLLAGTAGGKLASGNHLRIADETPMCNLYLSMLDKAGVHLDKFGDSTGRLTELARRRARQLLLSLSVPAVVLPSCRATAEAPCSTDWALRVHRLLKKTHGPRRETPRRRGSEVGQVTREFAHVGKSLGGVFLQAAVDDLFEHHRHIGAQQTHRGRVGMQDSEQSCGMVAASKGGLPVMSS